MDVRITGKIEHKNNPKFPPNIGHIVVVEHPEYRDSLFIGSVYKYVWNNTAVILLLLNNRYYRENILTHKNVLPPKMSTRGLFLLFPSYPWKYVNLDKMNKLFNGDVSQFHDNVKSKYSLLLNSNVSIPKTQHDLTAEAIYVDPSLEKNEDCNIEDEFKDNSLLTDKGELQMNDLFKEYEINQILYDTQDKFKQPSNKIKQLLKAKLSLSESISIEDQKIVVNKNIAIRNIIESKEDEINEGRKIIEWLSKNIINNPADDNKIFTDIKMSIFNGYVHLARKGIKIDDVINEELIPNLKFYKWQYGIPIDYDTLKYILFQNKFQSQISKNIEEQKEAEEIFSQEYIIALQPEPKFQMWVLKRLIMAWYADDELQVHIRKVKVLINQWRARCDKKFNTNYGILPSIVVYPRYGKDSARLVLTKLSHYFMLYQNVGWNCSTPSYFVKVNNLIWYSNGSIDLKLYFRKASKEYKGTVENKSFDKYFTRLLSGDKLLFPFVEE